MKKFVSILTVSIIFIVAIIASACGDDIDEVKPIEDEKSGMSSGSGNSGVY